MHLGRLRVRFFVEKVAVFELEDECEELLVVLVLVPSFAILNGFLKLAHDGPLCHSQ